MDRRRFVPSPDGLEGRALLSLFGTSSTGSKSTLNNPAADVPVTFRQKELRVEHLPFYIGTLQPNRFVSKPDLVKLQADLTTVIGQLHKPPYPRLVAFNTHLRKILPHNNLSAADALTLNRDFANAISGTGATPSETANLVDDMTALARIDSQSRQPVTLATNDYALVLQTILGVGRPIQEPVGPLIAQVDGIRTKPGYAITHKAEPRFVGTYGVGNTVGDLAGDPTGGFNSAGDKITLVDDQGKVYGESTVDPLNGNYILKVTQPLAAGVYTFRVVATDPGGHSSIPSQAYKVKVVLPHATGTTLITGASTPLGPLSSGKA